MERCSVCRAVLQPALPNCTLCGHQYRFQAPMRAAPRRAEHSTDADPDLEPKILPQLGYLLIAAGTVLFLMTSWSALGAVAICVGSGMGLLTSARVRWVAGLVAGLAMAAFSATTAVSESPHATSAAHSSASFLVVSVDSVNYEGGELEVVGYVRNTANEPAVDPFVELSVFDATGVTLIADDTASPNDPYDKRLPPGPKAPFVHRVFVADEPARVTWSLSVPDHSGAVAYQGRAFHPDRREPAISAR